MIQLLSVTLLLMHGVPAQPVVAPHPDSAAVVAVVEKFHAALAAGDSAGVLSLLANDVVVLEAGGLETRADYRAHHLAADIGFAQAIESKRTVHSVRVVGAAAWVVATSVTQGTLRERAIDSAGAELMVLRRSADGWKIAAIHWSSRARRRA